MYDYFIKELIDRLVSHKFKENWFEFKDDLCDPTLIGEYISALSNAAALSGIPEGYLIWGVDPEYHEYTNTSFQWKSNINQEPLKQSLIRNITPDIRFSFEETYIESNSVVLLRIQAAKNEPTAFNGICWCKIGPCLIELSKFPKYESTLLRILKHGFPSLTNQESVTQDLSFDQMKLYFERYKVSLDNNHWQEDLPLFTPEGEYNLLAQLLSDNSYIPIRIYLFKGVDKTGYLYSVREFGYSSLLASLDKILNYADAINIPQADESGRHIVRHEVLLFNMSAFCKAMVNAFSQNDWTKGKGPWISVYDNRIEISFYGSFLPCQTANDFYKGKSTLVNKELSDILLQLPFCNLSAVEPSDSEDGYEEKYYLITDSNITITIPFNRIGLRPVSSNMNSLDKQILVALSENPYCTQMELAKKLKVSPQTIQNHINRLKEGNKIQRIGNNRSGYWKILDT